jgi:hypothetical protein
LADGGDSTILMRFTSVHRTAALLFLSVFALYLALSPVTAGGRGYVTEEIDSGLRMLEVFNTWVKGRPIPPMVWSRHGPVPVFLDLPFIKLGKLVVSPDFMMSMSPIVLTAGLVTILYLWLRTLTSPGMSLLLSLAAAFGTMLWPYAYIGLETKQSFFVLLAGYLGLARGKIRSWPRAILFGIAGGLAMTVKSTGIVLWPALAYLVYAQFRGECRSRFRQASAVALVMGGVWLAGDLGRRFYWVPLGGGYSHLRGWIVESPLQFFTNTIGIFGSPTKGVLVFAPLLLISLYAIPRAFRNKPEVTLFAVLATCSLLAFIALLIAPADEVWGPRYMHMIVAPLVLCIGAAWPRFEWRSHAPMLALAAVGVAISFLGAFYYYGSRAGALYDGGQNTMEWLIGDPSWNEVRFNEREFLHWLNGCPSTPWTALHIWVWEPPPGAAPWKAVDLQKYCQPQSLLLREWNNPSLDETTRTILRVCAASLVLGVVSLIALIGITARERKVTASAYPSS